MEGGEGRGGMWTLFGDPPSIGIVFDKEAEIAAIESSVKAQRLLEECAEEPFGLD